MRYWGVLLAGALAGIGGAYLSIGHRRCFQKLDAGRGFIALAALIFGKWRPVQALLACLLFGFTAVSIQMQGVFKLPSGENIPVQFIHMVPYVLTIVVLAGFIDHAAAASFGYSVSERELSRKRMAEGVASTSLYERAEHAARTIRARLTVDRASRRARQRAGWIRGRLRRCCSHSV